MDSGRDIIKILVVEDSATQAERLKYTLEQRGYEVWVAQDGKQALSLLSQQQPTLIISDIMMPEMDGYQLCRQIKSNEHLKDIPVILLTSLSDPQDVIRGLECRADNFITKPYDEAYLLSRIHYILINKEARQNERVQMGVEIIFGGQKHFITSDRQQILDLLISTYEAAIQKNDELTRTRDDLYALNEHLEELVAERTIALTAEIAERKRTETALREGEERFRATFEQAAVGLAHVGLDGRWLRVNQKLCDIVGYFREELLEKTFQEITHPEDLEADLDFIRQVESGVTPTYSREKRYIHKDGSIIWINLTVSLVREPSAGESTYFIFVIEDITGRKSLEEQFRQAQKMEAIGRLSGGVAHDFNNLLVVINGYTELLLKRQLTNGGLFHTYVEEIAQAGERASALTRQLLAFSRQQVLQPQVLNLNEVIGGMEKMLRRLIGEDIELNINAGQRLGQVKADPGQLSQVILNLVVNARDAMPQGGKLIIETTNVELEAINVRRQLDLAPGSYVRLMVNDTGTGMDTHTRTHIFEPFFTTKEQGKGTGLGLATVYGIVKQSGGDIWLYSESGRGTTFEIYLPRVGEMLVAPEPQPGPSNHFGEETILVVEDEEAVRKLALRSLELEGYTVFAASRGNEALRLFEQHHGSIHLLLTDVVMPGGMNGQELARQLKILHPRLKVLFMSGYTDETSVPQEVWNSGLFFLQKPFTPNVLLRKVREVLDKAQPE